MPKKTPKFPDYPAIPTLWRTTKQLLAQGCYASKSKGKSSHFAGGEGTHKGAKCKECQRPLDLLWDLDLSDPIFTDEFRLGFAPATRLPIYLCLQCLANTYCVHSDSKIQPFEYDRDCDALEEGESPFLDLEVDHKRVPLIFTPIPSVIDGLIRLAHEIGLDGLDKSGRKLLADWWHDASGMKDLARYSFHFSQLGGLPKPFQGLPDDHCPNPKCPASWRNPEEGHPHVHPMFRMKTLALIDDDEILGTECFQVVVSVCIVCFAVRCQYQCT